MACEKRPGALKEARRALRMGRHHVLRPAGRHEPPWGLEPVTFTLALGGAREPVADAFHAATAEAERQRAPCPPWGWDA